MANILESRPNLLARQWLLLLAAMLIVAVPWWLGCAWMFGWIK